jgi:hypothetical protein
MPLTTKDKEFLEELRRLLEEKQLRIEIKDDGFLRMVLRQNYGDRIERSFGVTRQGVRWRFNHLFNEQYVNALTTILLIESTFGTGLRQEAMAIVRQRVELIQQAQKQGSHILQRRGTAEMRGSGNSQEK